MQRKRDNRFCTQHMIHDTESQEPHLKSVPCPLDPKHNVFVKDLELHLLKCNARPPTVFPEWYKKDINSGNSIPSRLPDSTSDEDELMDECLKSLSSLLFPPLEQQICEHPGLQSRISELIHKKHPLQQSSLIGNLKRFGLLSSQYLYIELGCGRAELSRFVNLCIKHDGETVQSLCKYGFGLIDRGVTRMKADNKIVKEAGTVKPTVKRSRIDIKDLDLDLFIRDLGPYNVVGISKHLCGVATDLSLRMLVGLCLTRDQQDSFSGMLIAMCCRHACSWERLLPDSRVFLKSHGICDSQRFSCLKRVASWAVSKLEENDSGAPYNLSAPDRKTLGFKARRLLDESRVYALRKALPEFKIDMFIYADLEVTLENVCLSIIPLTSKPNQRHR